MRKKYPHEEIVMEIKDLLVNLRDTRSISDDMDMYYVGAAGYSPMERMHESNVRDMDRARELALRLVQIGEPAAEAVAKGLRMQGRWREELLPFAEKFANLEVIKEALILVAKRQKDPLAKPAKLLLEQFGKRNREQSRFVDNGFEYVSVYDKDGNLIC